jgi:hypothetical protein
MTLMVRSAERGVSNHEAADAAVSSETAAARRLGA